ncbi:acyl-CoA thioesterase [Cellulomonas sp. DKR-3]|uniref:Acyl-CoA thioesterase n=1 Tax=Cellulomonas fulva TaxID=2835530 RepID=A0ABS5TY26_9CELL|nr:thioesterase family protein [Cellulomonas fulva]MBT0994052.1 acyl-CoA thioesterase [Cellulomonas fulva]
MTERYGHHAVVPTRWNDNDQYGHVNNAVYYEAMDTAINRWLVRAGLDPRGGEHIAVCASSSCEYRASVSFPQSLRIGLRAARVGRTSVTWELGISAVPEPAEPGQPGPEPALAATGRFVHVFVDAVSRRPAPIPEPLRAAIERELVVTP